MSEGRGDEVSDETPYETPEDTPDAMDFKDFNHLESLITDVENILVNTKGSFEEALTIEPLEEEVLLKTLSTDGEVVNLLVEELDLELTKLLEDMNQFASPYRQGDYFPKWKTLDELSSSSDEEDDKDTEQKQQTNDKESVTKFSQPKFAGIGAQVVVIAPEVIQKTPEEEAAEEAAAIAAEVHCETGATINDSGLQIERPGVTFQLSRKAFEEWHQSQSKIQFPELTDPLATTVDPSSNSSSAQQ